MYTQTNREERDNINKKIIYRISAYQNKSVYEIWRNIKNSAIKSILSKLKGGGLAPILLLYLNN